MVYNIIQRRKWWLGLSLLLTTASIVFLVSWRLNLGIDFTGGSLLEVEFKNNRPTVAEITEAVSKVELGSLLVQPVGDKAVMLRFRDTSQGKHQETMNALREYAQKNDKNNVVEELKFDSIGPSVGQELKNKSLYAIVSVLLATIIFIAWAFRRVSKPVSSWKYGVAAVIAMFHDVLVVLGVFAFLGRFHNIEINTPFVAAVLTVLGYSVNDTIVVFDRIRENIPRSDDDFETTVNNSVNQVITRSIITSFIVLLVLVCITVFGGKSIRDFALALSIGVFVGTYSSIFLASPVLVVWEKYKK